MSQSSYDDQSQQQQNQQRSYESEQEEHHQEQNSDQIRKKKEQLLQLEEKRIKAELKQIPFGQLLRYRDLKAQVGKTKTKQIKKDRSKKQQPTKKKDKNSPKQIKIMKRPPKTRLKQIFPNESPKSIDPRFQNYTGTYNQDLATKSYSFIEDIRNNEIKHIKKQLKNKKIKEQNRQILLKNYNRITSDMKKFQHRQIQKKVRSQFKGRMYNVKERVIREHVQKAKLDVLDDKSQDRRMKKKQKQIQKHKFIEKKLFMNSRK